MDASANVMFRVAIGRMNDCKVAARLVVSIHKGPIEARARIDACHNKPETRGTAPVFFKVLASDSL